MHMRAMAHIYIWHDAFKWRHIARSRVWHDHNSLMMHIKILLMHIKILFLCGDITHSHGLSCFVHHLCIVHVFCSYPWYGTCSDCNIWSTLLSYDVRTFFTKVVPYMHMIWQASWLQYMTYSFTHETHLFFLFFLKYATKDIPCIHLYCMCDECFIWYPLLHVTQVVFTKDIPCMQLMWQVRWHLSPCNI